VPLNTPTTFEQTKAFSRDVAEVMAARMADRVVARIDKRLRSGKVLVDWGQNDHHKSTVGPVRAGTQPHPAPARLTPLASAQTVNGLTADVATRAATGSLEIRTVHAFEAAGSEGQHSTEGTQHASRPRLRTDLRSYAPIRRVPLPYLNCSRCRLSIEQHAGPALDHCPRCLSATGERIPLFQSPLPLDVLDGSLEESR
jgi:hypothetical protein